MSSVSCQCTLKWLLGVIWIAAYDISTVDNNNKKIPDNLILFYELTELRVENWIY